MCKSNKKPKIFCISGKAGHGKDTCARYVKEYFEGRNKKVQIIHYADLLKYICATFFGWDGVKDEKGRSLLQEVGVKTIKSKNPTFLIDFVANILDFFADQWDVVVIPDARFPEEIEVWQELGYSVTHWRVYRPTDSSLTSAQQKDITETSLDTSTCDVYIENKGSLVDLRRRVRELLFQEEIWSITQRLN